MQRYHSDSPVSLTVYFDGGCPVCSREVAVYQRQAAAVGCEWFDASTCAVEKLGPDLSRADALARFHVRKADGSLIRGARGFAALWLVLPRFALLGRIASIEPIATLLEFAYALFLKLRPLWRKRRDGRQGLTSPTSSRTAESNA